MESETFTLSIILIYLISGLGMIYAICLAYSILRPCPKEEEFFKNAAIEEELNVFSRSKFLF
jgi:hypothetical protein